jgi:hypothetical protein
MEKLKALLGTKKGKMLGLVVVFIIIAVASTYFNKAEARGWGNTTNITNNTYEGDKYEGDEAAVGACALGTAQSQFHATINSNQWQYGIGAGHCEGRGREDNALSLGFAHRINRDSKHAMMGSFSIGRSSDEITAIGFGINGHF